MPDRETIEQATPRCPNWLKPKAQFPNAGVQEKCQRLMVWDQLGGLWVCPYHGPTVAGEFFGAGFKRKGWELLAA